MGSIQTIATRADLWACVRSAASIFAFAAGCPSLAASNAIVPPPTPSIEKLPTWARAQKPPIKRALVIGIDQYQYAAKLPTPSFDADMVASTLRKLDPNFDVTRVPADQTTRAKFLEAIAAFAKTLHVGEVAFVFFSGHGLERDGVNYLVPKDSQLAERGREGFVYVSLPYLIEQIQDAGAGVSVIILDACRVDPFVGADPENDMLDPPAGPSASVAIMPNSPHAVPATASPPVPAQKSSATLISAGLSEMKIPQGFIVAYAAEPGKSSFSLFRGDTPEKGSIFTRRFVNYLATLNKPIDRVFGVTGGDVYALTGNRQKPFVDAFNAGEVNLLSNDNLEKDEQETWLRLVVESPPDQQLSGLREFVSLYPAGPYATAARERIQQLEKGAPPIVRLAQVNSQETILLSGALGTPVVKHVNGNLAVAKYDVDVHAAPHAALPRVIASLEKGDEVQVLDGAARPGWAKVILRNGVVGYVGSVTAQPNASRSAPLSLKIVGDDMPNFVLGPASGLWRKALQQASSTVSINVGPVTDPKPWRARQIAFLRALRLRTTLIAQGVKTERITLTFGSDRADADTAIVTLVSGVTQ